MSEQLQKLTPDRDLQCYFLLPSAIAAISGASSSGFTVSGTFRQQFDWAVVEWNRDDVFNHPAFRALPDGDLSGLVLSYEERRSGCIPFESNLVPTVDWHCLRIWTDEGGAAPYKINLRPDRAIPVSGEYTSASAIMTVSAVPNPGSRVGLCLLEAHYFYVVAAGDTPSKIATGIAAAFSVDPRFTVTAVGPDVQIAFVQDPASIQTLGANGNRQSVYGFVQEGSSCWAANSASFSGGAFPDTYRVTIDFNALKAAGIPTEQVRKLRWTWAADFQNREFERSEFSVVLSNWSVAGSNRGQSVAGPGSRRIQDSDTSVSYQGQWSVEKGNYSAGSIRKSNEVGSAITVTYNEAAAHDLYVGTRLTPDSGALSICVNGGAPVTVGLTLPGEDVLVRRAIGSIPAGTSTVVITNIGVAGTSAWFDFLEIVYPTQQLPSPDPNSVLTLATDWDTYHAQSLAAERTAWMIHSLGFRGCVNHYVGAMWFYELFRPGTQFASATVRLTQHAYVPNDVLTLAITSAAGGTATVIKHLILPDDNASTAALAIAGLVNAGTNMLWVSAQGNQLTFTARAMGTDGNGIQISIDSQTFTPDLRDTTLQGGLDGAQYDLDPADSVSATLLNTVKNWRVDLQASPRINRAARDWHVAFFQALKSYGLDAVAAFSTELAHVDPSLATGMAQRYSDGTAVIVSTPAVQTNFSPLSASYWQDVYADMARLQMAAGLRPYLQFGEVQWWYFPKPGVSMPFYDAYTTSTFAQQNGRALPVIQTNTADVTGLAVETAFLSDQIGTYFSTIRAHVQSLAPTCRFEALFPTDTNDTALNTMVNYPSNWTVSTLDTLKTECLSYNTFRNLDGCLSSVEVPGAKGFSPGRSAHLVGISDPDSPWLREAQFAISAGMGSVVLFALDQYCLVGMPLLPFATGSLSSRQG